ncbi:MAG TPA: hypothetical protein VFG89_08595 [Coriobacteriia bacterium]|nr:hypothetical protein [Coriobacteriia bacterium]
MYRALRLLLVASLLSGAVALVGCAKIAEKATEAAVEKATGVKVDKNGEEVTIKTEDGEATVSSDTELPADFPADVPIYENATVNAAMSNKTDQGMSYLVGLTSDDDAKEVFAWYKQAFEDKGWEIKSTMEVGDSVGGLSAEKGDLMATLSIGYGSEKKADMSLTVSPKQ